MDKAKVAQALRNLDTTKDGHWTQAGEPQMATVRMLSGDASLTREDLQKEFPDFSRTNTVIPDSDTGVTSAGSADNATANVPTAAPAPNGGSVAATTAPTASASGLTQTDLAEPKVDLQNLETAQKGEGQFIHTGRNASGEAINTVVTGTEAAPPAPAALAGAQSGASAAMVLAAEGMAQDNQDDVADQHAQLDAQIKQIDDSIADAERYTGEVAKKVLELQSQRDELILQKQGLDKPADPMQAYKKSVLRQNEQAAETNAAIGPAARALAAQLTGRSPLDQSIAAENQARARQRSA